MEIKTIRSGTSKIDYCIANIKNKDRIEKENA
jgi:hypothetical protein